MTALLHITRIRKAGGAVLCKRIFLGQDGRPVSDGSQCAVSRGTATRVILDAASPATSLAALINGCGPSEAIILGDYASPDDTINIVTAAKADPAKGRYARTLDTFAFSPGEPAVILLDFDMKAMPAAVAERIKALGGFEGAIASLLQGDYQRLARVIRASTSTGIRNSETGVKFPAKGGLDLYLILEDGADPHRFVRDLQARAWLAGLGWIMVAGRGALLIRSIVDVAVASPERLIFEGAPLVVPPLMQDLDERAAVATEGERLDSLAACPPLTDDEKAEYERLVKAAKIAAKPQADQSLDDAAVDLAERKALPIEVARAAVTSSTRGVLLSADEVHFDDDEIGVVSIADILADPARYHGETLADPLEGRWYGTGKAKLYHNGGANVVINSFAHGGAKYRLQHSIEHIAVAVEQAGEGAAKVFARLMPFLAECDPIDRERVRDRALKLGKVSKTALKEAIDREEAKARTEELKEKARKRAGQAETGSPETPFNSESGGDPYADFRAACDEINRTFFVLKMGASVVIGTYFKDEALGRETLSFMKPQDFRLLFANRTYLVGHTKEGKEKRKPLGDAWLASSMRRQYFGAGFYTKGDAPLDVLNLWRGWGYEPKPGNWDTLAGHLLDVICGGDKEDFDYLIDLLAYWVQNPEKVGEVFVLLKGLKGAGKGAFASILKRWFLHHFIHISQPKHLTGNFNAHLADCLFLFADEVVWGGDKQAEGALKALITESVIHIEPKVINSFPMKNRIKGLLASNNDWCAPVTGDERRLFAPNFSDHRKGDHAYFNKLFAAIEGGECQAMLHDLMHLDLAGFNHRDVPHTAALNGQKIEGMDSFTRWWMCCLEEGRILAMPHGENQYQAARTWPTQIEKSRVHSAYWHHATAHGDRHPKAENAYPRLLKRLGPSIKDFRPPHNVPRQWLFQALSVHRAEFEAVMNMSGHEWPEEEEEEKVHPFRAGGAAS